MIRRLSVMLLFALSVLVASCGQSEQPEPSPSLAADEKTAEKPADGTAAPITNSPTDLGALDLSTRSAGAFGVSGLSPSVMATLPALYRLRNLERCVVKFTHSVYVPVGWGYSTYTRTGHLLLLGEENGKTIGITTRCAMDFKYPGFQYVNPNVTDPKFVVGVVALEMPGTSGYDYHIVSHETPTFDRIFTAPNDYFKRDFLGSLKMKQDFWPQVLEGGDRVSYRTLGNNDLVFVEFDNLRLLGITTEEAKGGLHVSHVVDDSVAFRAGIKVGDIVEDINGVKTRKRDDIDPAKKSAPLNKEFTITVNRNGTRLTRYAVFHHSGNFLSSGTISSLGVEKPTDVLNQLLASLDQLGTLLSTNFYVHCERCHERISRAKVEREPSLLETVARFIPLAGALLSMQPAAILTALRVTNGINTVVEVFQWLSDVVSKAGDALTYLKTFPLGEPVTVPAGDVDVIDTETLELRLPGGRTMLVQPAYCRAITERGDDYLRTLLATASTEGMKLLALPDGTDTKGKTHCHLFLVHGSDDTPGGKGNPLDVYVNLMLINEGYSSAQDYGVSDGRSTRLVLESFRKIDKFEK
jgi:membrane-associated protease RseP (regulator of RpoE activity)